MFNKVFCFNIIAFILNKKVRVRVCVRSRNTKERVRVFVVIIISRVEEEEEKCVHSACGLCLPVRSET